MASAVEGRGEGSKGGGERERRGESRCIEELSQGRAREEKSTGE